MKNFIQFNYWSLLILGLVIMTSCSESLKSEERLSLFTLKESNEEIEYFEFKPDSINYPVLEGIEVSYAHQLELNKIVVGYYKPKENGEFSDQDSENDWGYRVFLLDMQNKIKFQSQGMGDTYLFEPHFYKNKKNGKLIIICQLAFEYYFGGEAFVFEDGKIEYIGNLNIEYYNIDYDEKCLTDIVLIKEESNRLSFTFDTDSLILDPGGVDEEVVKNNNIQYVFENQKLRLKK